MGAKKAVQQLGDLHALAMSYVEVYRGRWDFRTGSVAALVTYAAIQVLALAISFAFSSGVIAGGGHPASYSLWSGFGPFEGSAPAHSYDLVIFSPGHLLLMAIAFVIGSAHRLILRR